MSRKRRLLIVAALLAAAFSGPFVRGQQAPSEKAPAVPVLRFEIRVDLDEKGKMLDGEEDLTWTNMSPDAVPDICFHMYWNAFRDQDSVFYRESGLTSAELPPDNERGSVDMIEVRTAEGADLLPSMEYITPDGPGDKGDRTVARFILPAPVQPGASVRLKIRFRSRIPRTVARSGYYRDSFFIGQWYPKPGVYEPGRGWNCHAYHRNSEFFSDFGDYIVHITVPESHVVGATGLETAVEKAGKPGRVTRTFVQPMVHDFAWTSDPRFIRIERWFRGDEEVTPSEYEKTAALLGLPASAIRLPDVRMILLIEPEHRGQTERHFRALRAALKYYGLLYGPYPYATVTMVDPPYRTDSGGMEYPTLFTAGTSVLTEPGVLSPEGVIVHEFGHGYWYGLVANNEFEEAWLDEGINTYSTAKVLAMAYGEGRLGGNFRGLPLGRFLGLPKYFDYELNRAGAINAVGSDPVTAWSWKFIDPMSYSANVYNRAATLLDTLELYLGDEAMARTMRVFHSRYRFRHPKTADFMAVAAEVSGRDLGWFFRALFMDTLEFDYGVGRVTCAAEPGPPAPPGNASAAVEKKAEGKKMFRTRIVLRRFGEAVLGGDASVEFKVRFADGTEENGRWDGRDRWARFEFVKPARVERVTVDPRGIWLIDSDMANNSWQKARTNRNMLGLMGRIVFALQNLFLTASSWI